MKIIFLNCWMGEKEEELLEFLAENRESTDIFCFQENTELFKSKLDKILPGYNYCGSFDEKWDELIYGKAIYYKKDLQMLSKGSVKLYEKDGLESAGNFKFLEIGVGGKKLMLLNVHGKTAPGNKKDTPDRLKQTKKILNFLKNHKRSAIAGGDFNLDINTKSVTMFEESGYRNLIKEFRIKTTRNSLAWDEFKDEPGFVKQYFADYVFVTQDIEVKSFEVPNILISDHNPMVLEFEF